MRPYTVKNGGFSNHLDLKLRKPNRRNKIYTMHGEDLFRVVGIKVYAQAVRVIYIQDRMKN